MKANAHYNDFIGTAAADISDSLGFKYGDYLESFGKYFKIDESRFEVVGISVYGTDEFNINLVCIDKKKSTQEKEHIVNMSVDVDDPKDILNLLFKRLHIVLHAKFDEKYAAMNYDEEIRYEDFHETDEE